MYERCSKDDVACCDAAGLVVSVMVVDGSSVVAGTAGTAAGAADAAAAAAGVVVVVVSVPLSTTLENGDVIQ